MIQLYDTYQQYSRDLHDSLEAAGFNGVSLVINDNGFLPDGVTSPYAHYCGMEEASGKPLFFNQVPVPYHWEIRGSNQEAGVWNYTEQRAKIFYTEPKHRRLVETVDWLDKNGKVRSTDHYNKFGWLFARTNYDEQQSPTIRTYYNEAKEAIVVENFKTGDIILTTATGPKFFENRIAFVHHYFEELGLDTSQIWYNSLSTPFFLSYNYQEPGQDILFWNEPVGDAIPGNMEILLKQADTRTQQVFVQDESIYNKMMQVTSPEQQAKIQYLGLIYPNRRQNKGQKNIFILTNTDQVEQLEFLVNQLPDFHFNVAALTEMSQNLTRFEQFSNVDLYPNITTQKISKLFDTCDVYMDINHGSEVMSAIRQAFENNQLILAFNETAHSRGFIAPEHIFSKDNPQAMVDYLQNFAQNHAQLVEVQRSASNTARVEDYQRLLKG